jgi:hypothetical protein
MRFGGADHHEGLEGVDPERMLLELTPNSLMLGGHCVLAARTAHS